MGTAEAPDERPTKPLTPRKRILFVTYAFEWGGLEKHLEDLILRLDTTRVEPLILYFGQDVYRQTLNERNGLNINIEDAKEPRSFLGFWRAFAKRRPYTVLFVKGQFDLFPWSAYLAARVSGAKRVVAIEHLQAEPAPDKLSFSGFSAGMRELMGWRARYILKIRIVSYLCHMTICVSNAVRNTLIQEYGYPPERTVTILNGIDLKHYGRDGSPSENVRFTLGIDPSHELIICIARLVRLKRIDILLETMSLISRIRASCKCVILGSGPLEKQLRAKCEELDLSSFVIFVGHVQDVRPYLEAADVYVSASEREGFGLGVAEGMAYELPCAVTRIGGHDELVLDGLTGLLVPPGSPTELARAIEYLLDHKDEARAMGTAARKRLEKNFNIDETMAKIQAALVN